VRGGAGVFYGRTVIAGTRRDDDFVKREVCCPVVGVTRFTDTKQATSWVNVGNSAGRGRSRFEVGREGPTRCCPSPRRLIAAFVLVSAPSGCGAAPTSGCNDFQRREVGSDAAGIPSQQGPAFHRRMRTDEEVGQHLQLAAAASSVLHKGLRRQDQGWPRNLSQASASVDRALSSPSSIENDNEVSA